MKLAFIILFSVFWFILLMMTDDQLGKAVIGLQLFGFGMLFGILLMEIDYGKTKSR